MATEGWLRCDESATGRRQVKPTGHYSRAAAVRHGRPVGCTHSAAWPSDLVAFNCLTQRIIGAAIEVHRHLGPGLLESIYQECLIRELALRQLSFAAQRSAPVVYKGVRLAASYRLDLIVECVVVVEVESVASFSAVHHAQTLTYMRIADCPVGMPGVTTGWRRIGPIATKPPRAVG
jgi:GxxExxY protein